MSNSQNGSNKVDCEKKTKSTSVAKKCKRKYSVIKNKDTA